MPTPAHVSSLSKALAAKGTKARAVNAKAYLKSREKFFGTSVPAVRAIAADFYKTHRDLGRAPLKALAQGLYRGGYHEQRILAFALLERYLPRLVSADLTWLEKLLRASTTWAELDGLAQKIAGGLVARDPRLKVRLRRWARDESFWMRRAALLALENELRAGRGDFALFTELAVPMLGDAEFFIRKAIGWVLREVSKKRPMLVYAFVLAHAHELSALSFREGTKHLPTTMRKNLTRRRAGV